MKLSFGPTFGEKLERWKEWHEWFAWRPVRVGRRDWRWLETVQRRKIFYSSNDNWGSYFEREYRLALQ